jgi:hypothetical protein
MILEGYVIVNGYQAKALFNIGTIEDYLISGTFISINQIATENLEVPIFLKVLIK